MTNQTLSREETLRLLTSLALRGNTFAGDLTRRTSWSERQAWWADKLAREEKARLTGTAAAATVEVDAGPIKALFDLAGSRLKWPKIRATLPSGVVLVLKRAGAGSRYSGQILLTDDQPFGSNKFFGRINDNAFVPGRDCTDEVVECLGHLAADPVAFAREHGHRTGNCCFCNKALTDDVSVRLGFGPVCAKKWGLDHTVKAARRLDDHDHHPVDPCDESGAEELAAAERNW